MFKKSEKIIIKGNRGFALLFTVVIVSAVAVITAGLSSAVYKQSVLSSLARDSQSSFYQADTASDCALYADLREVSSTFSTFLDDHSSAPWKCGGLNLIATKTDENGSYNLLPVFDDEKDEEKVPCFRIYVTKSNLDTYIKARGYNICDKTNKRTVEREIEIDYKNFTGE